MHDLRSLVLGLAVGLLGAGAVTTLACGGKDDDCESALAGDYVLDGSSATWETATLSVREDLVTFVGTTRGDSTEASATVEVRWSVTERWMD